MRHSITVLFAAALVAGAGSGQAQVKAAVAARVAPAAAALDGVEDDFRFAEAAQLYRSARWSAAYGRFTRLADRGHADAARIALVMLRHGRELYGTEWTAAPAQVAGWERSASNGGPFKVLVVGE